MPLPFSALDPAKHKCCKPLPRQFLYYPEGFKWVLRHHKVRLKCVFPWFIQQILGYECLVPSQEQNLRINERLPREPFGLKLASASRTEELNLAILDLHAFQRLFQVDSVHTTLAFI